MRKLCNECGEPFEAPRLYTLVCRKCHQRGHRRRPEASPSNRTAKPRYLPDPETIARECLKLQASWTEEERQRRRLVVRP